MAVLQHAGRTLDLRLAYSAHFGDWHARSVPANWSGYTARACRLSRCTRTANQARRRRDLLSCAAALVRIALTPFRVETITGPEPIAAVPTPSIEGSPVETVDRQAQRVSDDSGPPPPLYGSSSIFHERAVPAVPPAIRHTTRRTSPEGHQPRRDINMTVIALSARRSSLASFENAYAVAIQLRENTGVNQFVVRTDNPIQPFRVSRCRPHHPESLLALVA